MKNLSKSTIFGHGVIVDYPPKENQMGFIEGMLYAAKITRGSGMTMVNNYTAAEKIEETVKNFYGKSLNKTRKT